MYWILFFDKIFARIAIACGTLSTCAMLLLTLNVFYDVIMRYAFNDVSIGMQELEWHLYAVLFLLGIPYAIQKDGHVRVDLFYEKWSDRTKAWINLWGVLLFIQPFIILIAIYGIDFTYQSFEMGESSGDPGGLPYRWLIKAMIPLSFILVGLSSLGMLTQALRVIIGHEAYPGPSEGNFS